MWAKVATLFVILFAVQFGVIYWVYDSAKIARSELVDSQRQGCERSKLDRKANARFQRAHSKYIQKVTGAASVKEDVKHAARQARQVFVQTARELTMRSQINCKEEFP